MSSWFQNYCAICDKQCGAEEMYCSLACRNAEECHSSSTASSASELYDKGSSFSLGGAGPFGHSQHSLSVSQSTPYSQSHLHSHSAAYYSQHSSAAVSRDLLTTESSAAPRSRSPDSEDRTSGRFLYESPMLRPTTGQGTSPPLSPLLIPVMDQDIESTGSRKVSGSSASHSQKGALPQSLNSYRRWLRG